MKRFEAGLSLAACVAGAILMSSSALAGSRTSFTVTVDPVGMVAGGAVGAARNSSDLIQLLSCRAIVDASGPWGSCVARNIQGLIGSCATADPNMLNTIRALNGDSIVRFRWDSFGFCTEISVSNGSETEPKR